MAFCFFFFSSRRRHTRCALVTGVQSCALPICENIFLLAGHDAEKPLASTEAGSLSLRDGDDALHIEARVVASTTWATDALAALAAGLTKGLSPGFRVKPGGDLVTRTAEGLLRTVTAADLFEVSLVTRPARSEEHTSELQSLMRNS